MCDCFKVNHPKNQKATKNKLLLTYTGGVYVQTGVDGTRNIRKLAFTCYQAHTYSCCFRYFQFAS